MENIETAVDKIREEIKGDLSDTREEFLEHFDDDTERFIQLMSEAFLSWVKLDEITGLDPKKAIISGLVYSAITQHIVSLRLFISGYIVAAGNTQRQVIETIALALLCSCKELGVLEKFDKDQYSTNKAITHALAQHSKLKINKAALEILRDSRDFYNMYSHPTKGTLASHIGFNKKERVLYVGASFDEGKLEHYKQEVSGRVSLAEVFNNFVEGITDNVSK